MHHMQEPHRARIKRTLVHMAEQDGNIKYDQYTGKIKYDGVTATDSDVRELLSTLISKKKRLTVPKRWDLFMCLLKVRTGEHTSRVEVEYKCRKWGLGLLKDE